MNVSVINKRNLTDIQEDVLERFMDFQEAMIEKNPEKLNEIICDNYTLTHMSGKHRQNKNSLMRSCMEH